MRALRALVAGRSVAAALVLLALAIAGCSSAERDPLPNGCTDEPDAIMTALIGAPDAVALADGTRLSSCISRARTNGELQSLGIVLMGVADRLRAQVATEPAAALRLGYLAGAVQAGATKAHSGIADQLARRIGQVAVLDEDAGAAATAELQRGRRAGERSG